MKKELTVTQQLKKAQKEGYGIGAFNIFNGLTIRAVVAAAEECNMPVILQTSVGTVKYYGAKYLAGMVKNVADQAKVPVYLHLDHCGSVEFAKECVDAGWDSIMVDFSKLPFEENIAKTREAADYAHAHGVECEGELGVIEGVEEEVSADVGELAQFDDCLKFTKESGIDFFAPALGTAHGVYKGTPKLNFDLPVQLTAAIEQPLVCHGGTGLTDEMFAQMINNGVSKLNISTAIKHAYIDGAKQYISVKPEEYNPLHIEETMFQSVKATAKIHINVFANGRNG